MDDDFEDFEDFEDVDDFPSMDGDGDDLTFQPGIKDWERVVLGGTGMLGVIPENKIERAMMDPEERFKIYIDAISRKLSNIDGIDISEESIGKMIDKVSEMDKVSFKNPKPPQSISTYLEQPVLNNAASAKEVSIS